MNTAAAVIAAQSSAFQGITFGWDALMRPYAMTEGPHPSGRSGIAQTMNHLKRSNMEHAIGEIITLPDGRRAEVVEAEHNHCNGCLFARIEEKYDCDDVVGLNCCATHRTDCKNVIYKEIKEY